MSQQKLIQVATPDSIARLPKNDRNKYWEIYFKKQIHSSLIEFINSSFKTAPSKFYQVRKI